jgi:hypothetical protein
MGDFNARLNEDRTGDSPNAYGSQLASFMDTTGAHLIDEHETNKDVYIGAFNIEGQTDSHGTMGYCGPLFNHPSLRATRVGKLKRKWFDGNDLKRKKLIEGRNVRLE